MAGGKRKILMKRRETKEQRAVSFSKRRRGLLNKVAEYCLRTRSQVAMVVSSPVSDKTFYTFGHSSVDSVFDAFVNNRVPEAADNENIIRSGILLFNEIKDLEIEKSMSKEKKKRDHDEREGFWEEYEKLGNFESIGELQVIVDKLEKAREKAIIRMNELLTLQVLASDSCRASTSESASADDDNKEFINFGTGYNNRQEVMAAGLESDAQQDCFGNFLSVAPCTDTNTIGHHQNWLACPSYQPDCDDNKEFINFGTGYNNRQEVMAASGLESDPQQDCFGNFLSIAPCLCPLIPNTADTNTIGHQNWLACPSYLPDVPIAIVNEFGQLLLKM